MQHGRVQKPKDIDDYLAGVEGPRRAALAKLRKTLHSLLPGAVECISYSMPAFRYRDHVVAGFLATSRGCSYFPFSGTTLATLAPLLREFGQTKSALHFDPEHPLPAALVKQLLHARIAELGTTAGEKTAKPRKSAAKRKTARAKPRASKRGVKVKRAAKPKRRVNAKR